MRLRSSLLRLRCLGSYPAGDFPDICWGFVVRGSCSLYSFLYNFLELGPCSCLYSLELECCSSSEERLMSCIVGRFVLEGKGCSIEGAAVEGKKLQSFCFLRIRFGVILLSGHWRGPS